MERREKGGSSSLELFPFYVGLIWQSKGAEHNKVYSKDPVRVGSPSFVTDGPSGNHSLIRVVNFRMGAAAELRWMDVS